MISTPPCHQEENMFKDTNMMFASWWEGRVNIIWLWSRK